MVKRLQRAWNVEKWKTVDHWPDRTSVVAKHIEPNSSVLDLGCGRMELLDFLPDIEYQGVDCVDRGKGCIVCDFNEDELPPIRHYDYVVCAGLIEYLIDLRTLFIKLKDYGGKIIVSHRNHPLTPTAEGNKLWGNEFTNPELKKMWRELDYTVEHLPFTTGYQGESLFILTYGGSFPPDEPTP